MRRYRLLIIGVAAYLLFMLALFPANVAWSLFSPKGIPLQLSGISGTLWAGSATQASWKGQSLGSMHWELQLLPLLLGKLGTDFSLQTAQGYMQGLAKFPLSFSSIRLNSLEGQIPLAELMRFAPTLPIPVSVAGNISLNISELELDTSSFASSATGRINWHGAEVLSPQAFKMGNLQADISTDDKGVLAAQLKNLDGPLQLDAQFQLKPDRSYNLAGTVGATAEAETSLQQALNWLGKADGNGKHRLNLNGHL